MSAAMSANGFFSRSLVLLSRRTARSFLGSQTRWNPPIPLMARIRPFLIRAAASGIPPGTRLPVPASRRLSRGPQTGQAMGWAWYLLSRGSPYSLAQSGHIGKPDMVVDFLS